MPAYSFKDVSASISGPGGTFSIVSSCDGVSEEGILIESVRQRSTMTVGVDGGVVHNLLAGEPAKCTITLLKTAL